MTAAVLLAAGYFAARCAVGHAGSRLAIVYGLLAGAALLLASAPLTTVIAAAGPARTPEVLGWAGSLLALAVAALIIPRAWAAWETASRSGWVFSLAGVLGLGAAGLLHEVPAGTAALTITSALCLAGGMGLCWRAWQRAGAAEAPAGKAGRSDVARLPRNRVLPLVFAHQPNHEKAYSWVDYAHPTTNPERTGNRIGAL